MTDSLSSTNRLISSTVGSALVGCSTTYLRVLVYTCFLFLCFSVDRHDTLVSFSLTAGASKGAYGAQIYPEHGLV